MSCPERHIESQESRLQRALLALPILALSGVMGKAFAMGEPIAPVLNRILETSVFDLNGMSVPVIKKFYGIGLLDEIFGHITVAFAQLQFFTDQRAYWQSLVFMTDYAGIYAILFFESCRPSNRKTIFQFPFLLTFLAQLIPVGFMSPLYFYLFYVFTPTEKLTGPSFLLTNWSSCASVLPTVLLAYHVPHLPSFFHESLESRHWWNWVWQLYPVWGSLGMFVFSKILSLGSGASTEAAGQKLQLKTLRITVGVLAAINISIYWYTLYNSNFSMAEMFIPKYFSDKPQDADVALRTIIQYDHIMTFSAALLWLGYHFRDLEVAGICKIHHSSSICIAAIISGMFSPGTFILLGWLAREELLASRRDD
ncbi:hypothetical protein BGZ61DRAFT_592543 [Ilyonectria robusta]|uniref:uncharacterized protein n=1 Tax=Ilyonectria robusta TaxID=1079257 RepID=UPI001E8DFD63|nr:uncharacterized protein BGZ61DRAFT_592543 [Ilyonectria robusta]KAH8667754.1 hypothetical protein BGZ61DRAFT_592543 [Ilyonectria robusta]